MAEWTIITLDRDVSSGTVLGVTQAMKVPGGMVIRTASKEGIAMVFVPIKEIMIAQGRGSIDAWIEENKVT